MGCWTEQNKTKMKLFVLTILYLLFCILDLSFQRNLHQSIHRNHQDDSSLEDDPLSEEVSQEEILDNFDADLQLMSLLMDRVILQSLREHRRLIRNENSEHNHRRKHRKHRNKDQSERDMIPYPRTG